jgi:conjugal transfer pilus assembly protein TraB
MSIADKVDVRTDEPKDVKKRKQNWIPSNSIFKATLVTGVYAPTLAKGKQSPYPVVLRLKDLSFFPNEFRKDLSGCFIGGEAYGNLSDERVNVRLNNLSCLSENNISVIDVPVSGFVQGEDGIIGLAGRVVSKQGQIMAAAFVASFLQGMGEAFSLANQSYRSSWRS